LLFLSTWSTNMASAQITTKSRDVVLPVGILAGQLPTYYTKVGRPSKYLWTLHMQETATTFLLWDLIYGISLEHYWVNAFLLNNFRLTHSASKLSGFTYTISLFLLFNVNHAHDKLLISGKNVATVFCKWSETSLYYSNCPLSGTSCVCVRYR